MAYRVEVDSMGEFKVPEDALYGAQTARAVENFPVSGIRFGREFIRAIGLIKLAAAQVNNELGLLDDKLAEAIVQAADEVVKGQLDAHFPVDVFQTGSGTSTNMNANEVIANRAILILGGMIGSKQPVHPNDHVNMGQSSNDVFPSALHIAASELLHRRLLPALKVLGQALGEKSVEFDDMVKIGRTHLQDATPIRLGQEFSGYVSQIEHGIVHLGSAGDHLRELAMGGTAVGTGINAHQEFGSRMAERISDLTGLSFREAANHFEAQAAQDAAVQTSGSLKTIAASLIKIANDIRLLGSGPRLGLGELKIPAVQPGSSIMPGKVNPVIAESLIMVCAQVIANDSAITLGGLYGHLQLNAMQPLIARNLLEQMTLLANGVTIFKEKLVDGLEADRARIGRMNEESLSLATALVPLVGYDRAAEIAREAYETGRTVRQVVLEKKVMPEDRIEAILDLRRQTEPGS
jgi:fumarate hydratase class II